ncbi:MAG: hypothetical protein HC888_01830 [Candidatus Competibacteraceae bacterium]|nr:hypothetical protein [Candidatus Competibacteraceae bacterium]
MRFARKTRLFCEYYLATGPSVLERGKSLFYVYTLPIQEGSISIDTDPRNDEAYLLFEDEQLQSLAFHRFDNRIPSDIRRAPVNLLDATHEVSEFSHEASKLVGYNRLIGTVPGFNHGLPLTREIFEICSGRASYEDVFEESDFSFTQDGNRIVVDNDSSFWFKSLTIEYIANNPMPIRDPFVSLYFQSEDLEADNVLINVPTIAEAGVRKTLGIETGFYRGAKLQLEGSVFGEIDVQKISAAVSDESRVGKYVILGVSPTVAFDERRNIFVFYHNQETSNIDVVVSGDSGRNWFVQTSIIRLAADETADMPYVVPDRIGDSLSLFYRLNGQSLMVMSIDPKLIVCEDADKEYVPPEAYDVGYERDLAIGQYSEFGKALRRLPSVFVVADIKDAYVAEQIAISEARQGFNDDRGFRFVPPQNADDELDATFESASVSAYRDSRGGVRICYQVEGKLFVKRSSSPFTWTSEIKRALVHRNIDQKEPINLPIAAPSFVYNRRSEAVYLFYYNDDALFVRIFDDGQIRPDVQDEPATGTEDSWYITQNLKDQYEDFSNPRTKPWFLVGRLSAELLQAFDGTSGETPFANFGLEDPVDYAAFSGDDYGVDTGTPVVGYMTKEGLLRAFYKSQQGQICGLSFNGSGSTLDVHRSYDPNATEL